MVSSNYAARGTQRVFVNQLVTQPRHLLVYSSIVGPIKRSLHVWDFDTRADKTIVERGVGGHLLPDGHLVYFRRGSLLAVSFDMRSLSLAGSPTELLTRVADFRWHSGRAALSDSGTLAWVPRPEPKSSQLAWLDPTGHTALLPLQSDQYRRAEVSPNGDLLAIVKGEDNYDSSLWTYRLKTGEWRHILDSNVPLLRAQWSPDSAELVVSSANQNEEFANLYRLSLADPQKAQRLTEEPDFGQFPLSWSQKANAILFMDGNHSKTNGDIMILPLGSKQPPKPLVATPGWDRAASFSPDGLRFVYESDDKGQPNIFVRAYDPLKAASTGPIQQISREGGRDPLWSPDGGSLYYTDLSHRLIQVSLSPASVPGAPRTVTLLAPSGLDQWTRSYSMAPDGRILIKIPFTPPSPSARIQMVVNLETELPSVTR